MIACHFNKACYILVDRVGLLDFHLFLNMFFQVVFDIIMAFFMLCAAD